MENRILLQVRNMTVGNKEKILFPNISFDIFEGDCIMLCGANGSGKTTLMKSLAGLSNELNNKVIMIPARVPKIMGFTLMDFVRICCFSGSDMFNRLSPVQESAIDKALHNLSLSHLADRDISTLSDGEFQKACIASALIREASVIMLDEPTAFLDAENRISVLRTLRSLCNDTTSGYKPAIIFSTHDLHDGLEVSTRVIALGADRQLHISETDSLDSRRKAMSTIFTNESI